MPARRKKRDAKLGQARDTRSAQDRAMTEDRELTDEERLMEFRMKSFQSALPDLPHIEGYHVCWLTTTNPRDPIHGRMRLGYEPIKISEVPGFSDQTAIKSGEYEGCIGVNEMVAFKLPLQLYEQYMYEVHHRQPLEEEEKLKAAEENAKEAMKGITSRPVEIMVEKGSHELGQAPEPPPFSRSLGEVE